MAATRGETHHQRTCFLSKNGQDFRVCDIVSGPDAAFTFRLHFHPDVKISTMRQGRELLVALPNRTAWRFLLRGGSFALEDSLYLGGEDGPRQARQIVLHGIASPGGHMLNWSLKKLTRQSKGKTDVTTEPLLPF
jgi:uncharacterized heparinase superfamily protein